MKRRVISMLLASAMVVSMTACGGSSTSSNSSNNSTNADAGTESAGGQEAADPSAGGNTLTIAAWDPGFNIPAIKAAAEDYKANVNPDFVLEVVEQAGSGDVETAVTNAASAGDYSNLQDIVLFQDHSFQKFHANYPDAWVDVNDVEINWADFSAEKLDYSTVDGVHYGFPVDAGTVISAYRVDLLEQCGYTMDDLTGITWDEFITIGEKVYAETGKYLLCMDGDGNDLIYLMLQAEGVSQFKDGMPYITENETLVKVTEKIVEMAQKNVLLLTNSWNDYVNTAIQGDQVAGVMNGNWIIPTMRGVEANSGKWEITTMPTLTGAEGYSSNGGSSLYITANCDNVALAKDFLSYTFGGSTTTYDGALLDGGVISTYVPAGESEVYNEGVAFFNNTPIYAQIVEMSKNVQIVEQSDYHYSARTYLAAAIINAINGADLMTELKGAEDQLKFEMGL